MGEDLAAAVDLVSLSGEVDALLVVIVGTRLGDPQALLTALSMPRAALGKIPIVLVAMGGLQATPGTHDGVTVLGSVDAAVGAMARVSSYATWLREPRDAASPNDEDRAATARASATKMVDSSSSGGCLSVADATELLSPYGLAPSGVFAPNTVDAARAAAEIGFPVAVKVADPEIVHKTDRGLVRSGLRSIDEVVSAVHAFEIELKGAPVPVLVQPMASGVELAMGIVRDPSFGPLIMVAAGGVATEVWNDRAFLIPPISPRDAARVIRSLRIWPLLDGYRGAEPVDVAAVESVLISLGQLAIDVPQLAEIDLNPVIATPNGVVLVDVKARLTPPMSGDAGIPRRLRDAARYVVCAS